jgi:hypothetical protein
MSRITVYLRLAYPAASCGLILSYNQIEGKMYGGHGREAAEYHREEHLMMLIDRWFFGAASCG